MVRTVFLDAAPLGLLADTRPVPAAVACRQWADAMLAAGHQLLVPEVADYDVRRELLRLRKARSVALLDQRARQYGYLELGTPAVRRAAELWAFARQTGQPTAGDNTIDADMILVAQAETLGAANSIITTVNVGHLARFFPADLWSNITP